jgi:ATPase family associated with various cellular activities (AAA)
MGMNTSTWQTANQQYLAAALGAVRQALVNYVALSQGTAVKPEVVSSPVLPTAVDRRPTALDQLVQAFGLSDFERDLLLFCAGLELEAAFAAACGAYDPQRPYATFSLALAALPAAHWSALMPTSPLRYWRLIEVGTGDILTHCPVRIDEAILHYLGGMPYWDDRLQGLTTPVALTGPLPPSQQALAAQIAQTWHQDSASAAIQLGGETEADKTAIAAAACALLDLDLQSLRGADIPAAIAEREALIRLWERRAILTNSALLLDCDHLDAAETKRALRFVEPIHTPVLIMTRAPLRSQRREFVHLTVTKPTPAEQQVLWQQALGPLTAQLNGQLEPLVMQFNLGVPSIQAASAQVRQQMPIEAGAAPLGAVLWAAGRVQARSGLDDLAQRIEPAATWADLVLPDLQRQTLREISAHVRHRHQVYERWGFAKKGARGLGISALFAGMSGTGKTMAAEVLAHELQLDLYRIDLSAVVSKYIGETEKNLRQVFDAAEIGGAILLFDEADALFGKRSEVKDSHDRHANIEVSYLLQRMEAYRGLAILTTNLKSALDTAFLRRIRFIVQFPFPDAIQRAEIWQHMFPPETPIANLDMSKLGKLNVAGGNIRNIALNAAFLAADAGESVAMEHLLAAARSEYVKLEKSLTEAEIGGWV